MPAPKGTIDISEIKINPNNPQKFNDLQKLKDSIKEFPKMMSLRPMIYDPKTKYVLGGNKRLLCLQEMGYKSIPIGWVKSADELTDEEKRRFIISDNIGFGEWDKDKLKIEWNNEDLDKWGLDLDLDSVIKQEIKEDEFTHKNEIETNIQPGDMFKIGVHKLLCGDSTKHNNYEKLMDGSLSDMVFTDPPYDLEDNYSSNIFEYAKDDSHIFIMNSDKLLIENVNNGFNWFRKFFAVDFRQARLISNNQPMTRVDLIAEFCKGKTKFNNLKDGFSTLIECAKIHNTNENINFGHKQAKKVELPAKFIEHYSVKDDLIVDYFGGSGSTMAACEQLGRICYMIENCPKNCQIIIDRMKKIYNLEAINTN